MVEGILILGVVGIILAHRWDDDRFEKRKSGTGPLIAMMASALITAVGLTILVVVAVGEGLPKEKTGYRVIDEARITSITEEGDSTTAAITGLGDRIPVTTIYSDQVKPGYVIDTYKTHVPLGFSLVGHLMHDGEITEQLVIHKSTASLGR